MPTLSVLAKRLNLAHLQLAATGLIAAGLPSALDGGTGAGGGGGAVGSVFST